MASPLLGRFQVSNILGAAAAGLRLGIPERDVAAAIAGVTNVPGRLERVDAGQPYTILVDYAHTPDALERLLAAVRELSDKKIILVFGCGGDRDRGKRPMMGAIAARLCDRVYVTSDNPRTENPDAIVAEVMAGAKGAAHVTAITDRRTAIVEAVKGLALGDVLLIAGKGHETYQIIGDRTLPFDDREEAKRALAQRSS